jgi:hypothetical protein
VLVPAGWLLPVVVALLVPAGWLAGSCQQCSFWMMASFFIEFLVFDLKFCPISPIKGKKSCLTVAFTPSGTRSLTVFQQFTLLVPALTPT